MCLNLREESARGPNHRHGIDEIMQGVDRFECRGRGMSDRTSMRLKEMYGPNEGDTLAKQHFSYLRDQRFFFRSLDADHRVALIHYDQLIERPEPQLRVLCTMLEIELVPRMTLVCDVRQVRGKPPPSVEPEIASLADGMLDRLRHVWLASPFGRAG